MIEHWIGTVPNSYLGQSYGFNVHKILLKPLSEIEADQILQEMREQIPPLQLLSGEQLKVTEDPNDMQSKTYYITLNGNIDIKLGSVNNTDTKGDTFYAFGQ